MKRLLKRLHIAPGRGQSMVEMAIIAPILIFFLIGIFEVGWALRNYLVLVNINREITRFAVRPGYMNFSNETARTDSYDEIKRWSELVAEDQLKLDFDKATTLIISHLVVDTGQPCYPDVAPQDCDCSKFLLKPGDAGYDPNYAFTKDDIVISPSMPNYKYQSRTFGITETVTGPRVSRLNYTKLISDLTRQNNNFNCLIMKKGGLASANNVIATELFHDQPQLFGFPLISNPFTDPVPLYTHTVMRLINAARAAGKVEGSLVANIDAIGEVCFAYPFIVSKDQLDGPPAKNPGDVIDILDEGGTGSYKGWVLWDPTPDEDPTDILKYQLQYPQMSINSYEDPDNPSDTALGPTDHVTGLNGNHLGQVTALVVALQNQEIIVPVWSSLSGDVYTVDRFIRVSIQGINGSKVEALYLGDAPEACNSPGT